MNEKYEYGKANLLQSLENARTFISYIDEVDSDLRWKLDEAIAFFTESVKLILDKYENER